MYDEQLAEWQEKIEYLSKQIWNLDIELATVLVNLFFTNNYPENIIL